MSLKFPAPLDPDERKDFVRDWTNELTAGGDLIQSASFALPTDGTADGLLIDVQQISVDNKKAVFWISASNVTAAKTLAGGEVRIQHTMITTGGRTFNETLIVKIREK